MICVAGVRDSRSPEDSSGGPKCDLRGRCEGFERSGVRGSQREQRRAKESRANESKREQRRANEIRVKRGPLAER